MAGDITVEIIRTNIKSRVCVVSINDNGVNIVTGNLGLELNPDGTANTSWIIDTAKKLVLDRRRIKAEQASIDKITSTINTSSEE